MRSVRRCCLILFVLVAGFCHGQSSEPPQLGSQLSPEWRVKCQQALKTPLPAEATVQPLSESSKNSALALYYGVEGETQDFSAARQTAWRERASLIQQHPGGYRSYSSTLLLAMIYANGLGTQRNPELALRMGCEATGYPFNLQDADLDRLQTALRGTDNPSRQYDVCDAGSSKAHIAQICDEIRFLVNRQHVVDSIAALTIDWTGEQKSKLKDLETAENLFGRGFSIYETPVLSHDNGPNTALDLFNRREMAFDNEFFALMKELLEQEAYSASVITLDAALNRNYSTLMNRLRAEESGAPLGPIEERGVERDWIAYRDAAVAVAKARFGPGEADVWYGKMTAQRTATLAKLSAIIGPPDPLTKPWLDLCAHARAAALPPDILAEPVKPQGPICLSYKPYYGIGGPADFKAARGCAIAERNLNDFYGQSSGGSTDWIGTSLNGSVVLTMLYANGDGVPRNVRLAQRFACEAIDLKQIDDNRLDFADSSEEREENRVNFYLDFLNKIASVQPPHIDMCGYVLGPTRAVSQCDAIAATLKNQKRASAFNALRNKFMPEQKSAFDRLMAAARAFLAAHVHNEILMTGHGVSNGQVESEYADEEEAFLADLQRLEHGDLPHTTPNEYAADDNALNTAYAKAIAGAPDEEGGEDSEHQAGSEPTRQSIRATERLWIVYRDTFADFGTIRYPRIARNAWLAFVILQRTKDLNNM